MTSLQWLTPRALERVLGVSISEMADLAESAESHYARRETVVGTKTRVLKIPQHPLRQLQRRLYLQILRRLKPHSAAYLVRGRGPLSAAAQHANNRWLFHGDLKDFYPSVTFNHVFDSFLRLRTPERVARILAGLVTVTDELPQGAPTSSAIGEIVLFPLDCRLAKLLAGSRLTYTRYADDLAVSGGRHLQGRFYQRILDIIADAGWELNGKGGIFGPRERHQLLGLVVNRDVNVPRERYFRLRYILMLAANGRVSVDELEVSSIRGQIGWIRATSADRANKLEGLLDAALEKSGSFR